MHRSILTAAGVLALGLAAPGLAPRGFAEEINATLDDQTGLALTIYNRDLALVRDQRTVALAKGENDVAFVDVSGQIRPQTVILKSSAGALDVLEQNFDFDLLTPQKLLEKSVGRTVRVIRTDPDTGDETVEEAKVLSVADGVVLQIGDRIETAAPGRIVFSEVPPDLRSRPTLVTRLTSDAAGKIPVELDYLTGGLGWAADYVASLSPDESAIDLKGWVTLTNTSGTTYRNAHLQLVAGEVNQVSEAMGAQMKTMAAMAAPAPAMTEQAMFEYHLYTLDRPTTIAQNQTKQVELLTGHGVPVLKEYRFDNVVSAFNARFGEARRVNADVRLVFENTEAAHLGLPLPKGVMRVYKADAGGNAIFVGEDAIEHTPKGETVKLMLGQAFDITARGRQTEFESIGNDVYESAYEIELKNAKKEPVTVTLSQHFPGDWKLLAESGRSTKTDSSTESWEIAIPPEGAAKLTYRVRVKY
ncbi:MAG TPA: DUF4139 domain-containing protein [Dongiaceae bacterium]|nr:DUF4139 domain-containing protein [Dongiaceae bacterium]